MSKLVVQLPEGTTGVSVGGESIQVDEHGRCECTLGQAEALRPLGGVILHAVGAEEKKPAGRRGRKPKGDSGDGGDSDGEGGDDTSDDGAKD